METKNNIFEEYLEQYLKETMAGKGKILTHICFVTKMHRKSAIRKFGRLQMRDPATEERRGRSVYYTADVTLALREIWEIGNEVCGELLHPMITEYVHILIRDKMWTHGDDTTAKLRVMSCSTIKRRVAHFATAKRRRKGISATRPSQLKHIIPTFNGPWRELPPGHGQIDTVLHKDTALGDAVYTLNYTDAATCLCIPRAQWNKGQEATKESMIAIKERLPFPWLGAHPDSGSEFINWNVKEWCDLNHIEMNRSRPNRKNDNMYVEERNGHVVRKMVGYINLDCPEVVEPLNAYYDVLYLYLLHFVAVRRMTGKEKIGSRYRRVYETVAKTPYQRIVEHSAVTEENKDKIKTEHETLNPLVLKRKMEKSLKKVYDIEQRFGQSKRKNSGNSLL
jgi:hypothetical protein